MLVRPEDVVNKYLPRSSGRTVIPSPVAGGRPRASACDRRNAGSVNKVLPQRALREDRGVGEGDGSSQVQGSGACQIGGRGARRRGTSTELLRRIDRRRPRVIVRAHLG